MKERGYPGYEQTYCTVFIQCFFYTTGTYTQSRQSAKLFLPSLELDSPTPSPANECNPPPPFGSGERGGRVPISRLASFYFFSFIHTQAFLVVSSREQRNYHIDGKNPSMVAKFNYKTIMNNERRFYLVFVIIFILQDF